MTQTLAYHLTPTGPWALGAHDAASGGRGFVRSDTLGTALMAMQALMEAPPDLVTNWRPEAIAVSSAFPLVGAVRCFPRPVGASPPSGRQSAWLSEGALRELAFGRDHETTEYRFGPGWTVEALPAEAFPLDAQVVIEERPRREIDRLNTKSQRDFFALSRFRSCGLWFLAQVRDDAQRDRLEAHLALLGEQGLGALRGLGCGRFSFARVAWHWPFAPSSRALLLSLSMPAQEHNNGAEYLETRRFCTRRVAWGPHARFSRRATVLAEGSWLSSADEGPPRGQIVTLSDQGATSAHAVLRPYLTFALPWPDANGSTS